ncbi:MAG TPA: methyltransferase domain-containing protein [Pirellulales bacterium]|nr:methyltransferase domain-containing protein [Pirellulales bacterium]
MNEQPRRRSTLAGLGRRHVEPEVMDQADLDPERHRHALAGLAQVNWLSHSAGIVWRPIRKLARQLPTQQVRVLDLACGGGDVLLGVARRARRHGLDVALVGYDRSATAIEYARSRRASLGPDLASTVRFERRDVLAQPWEGGFDVVMCSLFLHHLGETQAGELLRRMAEASRHLVLVNDLSRSRLGYLVALVACATITRSEVVRTDGPRSVAAAFRPREALALASRAGLAGTRVRRRWPFRFLLSWERTS